MIQLPRCRVCGSRKEKLLIVGTTKIKVCSVCGFFKRALNEKKK